MEVEYGGGVYRKDSVANVAMDIAELLGRSKVVEG